MITVDAKTQKSGFQTRINTKKYTTVYPAEVWKSVPPSIKNLLAQTVSYVVTHHLTLAKKTNVLYKFPPPLLRSMFFHGLFYSMAEAPFEFTHKKLTTADVLRDVYNSEFSVKFQGNPLPVPSIKPAVLSKNSAVMAFSFGKDSLLTYALTRQLDIQTYPVFMKESTAPGQNTKKLAMRRRFAQEFKQTIEVFPNTLGSLRQAGGMMWGWDMLLTQYTLLLLPYVYRHNPAYFFWSNEKSTDESAVNGEGYIINSTHEQSVEWILHLSNVFRAFGHNATVTSLLEPVHELVILSLLHRRYPDIGKYQLSCDGEQIAPHRWCGNCFECARVYVFLKAIGVDPKTVDLHENMLLSAKRNHHYLFGAKKAGELDVVFQSYPERLLSYYLAYKRGVDGPLMRLFVGRLLPRFKKRKKELFAKYFTLHPSKTIPTDIQRRLFPIYKNEVARLRSEFT